MSATVVMGKQGRIVVPADVRSLLGLREGDTLRVDVVDGAVTLRPQPDPKTAADLLYGMLAPLVPERSLVDELISDRRAEAAREAGRGIE
ncbi:MAG: AbrB/MazE/SpoVT family DNA-binding domain-containing protein [Austwickia sp.]|jgi:AbrB family looped-hinge helix DNA binding protein|nr:MAG: AbrB/MazE/SpoVT family DNA-binding domain-containing protein [Austwickia sp.]